MHIEEAEKIAAVIELKLKYELMQQERDEWTNRAGVWQARLLKAEEALEECRQDWTRTIARADKAEAALRELGDVHRRWELGEIDDTTAVYAINALMHARAALDKQEGE